MSSLLLTLLVGVFILGGTFIGMYVHQNKKFVAFSIGGAFGVIVSLIILELVPEAYNHLGLSMSWRNVAMLIIISSIGFLMMNILDGFIPHHEHEEKHNHKHKDDTCYNEHLSHIGVLATVSLFIHNIIEGMTLFATATASMSAGYLLCVGVGLHNIPLGIVVANTMKSKRYSVIAASILGVSSFLGGIIMSFFSPVNEFIIGVLISLTIGMMIYLCFVELLSQIIHSEHKKTSVLGIFLGLILIFISIVLGGHQH